MIKCKPRSLLVWQQTERTPPHNRIIQTFSLKERSGKTTVNHTLDLSESGIPVWALFIMKFIHAVGRPVGMTGLTRLKDFVERGVCDPPL